MFIGLIFDVIVILFVIVAILLIYSLLLISVETKTFEIGSEKHRVIRSDVEVLPAKIIIKSKIAIM